MGGARDFGSNQAEEIPEYFVYFGIFAVHNWEQRSGHSPKGEFTGVPNKMQNPRGL